MNISTIGYGTKDLKCFELPTQHVNLLSAFNKKSNRVKKQAMLGVKIGDFKINRFTFTATSN